MIHTNAISQGRRSVGSKDRVKQTNGRTNTTDRIIFSCNEVGKEAIASGMEMMMLIAGVCKMKQTCSMRALASGQSNLT